MMEDRQELQLHLCQLLDVEENGTNKPFIPMPVDEVEGINKLVVPLCDSRTVLLGWLTAAAPELFVPVEYSCKDCRRLACRVSISALVRLLRICFT